MAHDDWFPIRAKHGGKCWVKSCTRRIKSGDPCYAREPVAGRRRSWQFVCERCARQVLHEWEQDRRGFLEVK